MTMGDEALCQMERHLCLAQGEADFREIHASEKNLVLWRRSADPTVSSLLDDIDLPSDFSLRRELSPIGATERLEMEFDAMDISPSHGRRKWAADIARLLSLFCHVAGTRRAVLRLEVVADDACRLFHTDNVSMRMVCTYRGLGTEWLPNAFVNRQNLCQGDNDLVCRDWNAVQHLKPFWVALMKGKRAAGLIHRSPPFAGEPRVFLCLDPVE